MPAKGGQGGTMGKLEGNVVMMCWNAYTVRLPKVQHRIQTVYNLFGSCFCPSYVLVLFGSCLFHVALSEDAVE